MTAPRTDERWDVVRQGLRTAPNPKTWQALDALDSLHAEIEQLKQALFQARQAAFEDRVVIASDASSGERS